MEIGTIIAGIILILFGKQLFWLFIGIAGFFFGADLAAVYFQGASRGTQLILSVFLGIGCAVLAIFLKRVAIAVGGFMVGSYGLITLFDDFGWYTPSRHPILFIIGGVAGGILATIFFDPALIVLSSFFGALLIVETLPFLPVIKLIILVILCFAGIMAQSNIS